MNRPSYRGVALVGLALLVSGSSTLAQDRPGQTPGRTPGQDRQDPQAQRVRVGERAPDFSLPDLDGRTHSLQEHVKKGEVVVLEWVDPTTLHEGRHHEPSHAYHLTTERFRDRNVTWLAICSIFPTAPGQQSQGQRATTTGRDHAVEMCREAKERLGIKYPILLDEAGRLAQQFGLTHVPHVFIVDPRGTLAFSGPIEEAQDAATGTTNYFAQALQQVVDGQRVTVPQRDARGTTLPAGARRSQDRTTTPTPRPQGSNGQPPQGQQQKWTCPMHPEIVRDAPGTCPICNMKLEPKQNPPQ